MIRIDLDEKEVKKAVEYYVTKKFKINPDGVRKVDLDYSNKASVTLEEEDDE